MAKFIVLFEDNPDLGKDVRAAHMPDHLAFLERNADHIESAGPLNSPDGSAAGGLWVLDDVDADDVQRLIEEDPFWPTGLRKSVKILSWTQVFANGERKINV